MQSTFSIQPRAWSMARCVAGMLGLAACSLLLSACENTAPVDNTAMLPENERVSSVPWNKPEGWEGRGALGSLANNPRLTGGQ